MPPTTPSEQLNRSASAIAATRWTDQLNRKSAACVLTSEWFGGHLNEPFKLGESPCYAGHLFSSSWPFWPPCSDSLTSPQALPALPRSCSSSSSCCSWCR